MRYLRLLPVILVSMLAFTACSDDDDDDNGGTPTDNTIFVEFVIGSDTLRFEDSVNDYGNGPGYNSYYDRHGRLHGQFTTFGRNPAEPENLKSVLSIQVVKFFTDTLPPPYSSEFQMFAPGTLGFGSYNTDSTNVGIDGAIIAYTDADGKDWSSDLLFGSQPGNSNFTISSHNAIDNPLFGALTRGTFHCTVFDGFGTALELKGGRFHARTIYK